MFANQNYVLTADKRNFWSSYAFQFLSELISSKIWF